MKRTVGYAIGLAVLLCTGVVDNARAQCTNTPLPAAGLGPVNPANGYPRYYVDASGLALGPCLDLGGNCPTTAVNLPNPLAPLSFPANFPDEWFYWLANAKMTLPNGGLATLVMAVEGSFLNGVVVPGDQTTFSRLRIRVSNLVPNATYTITHPYGVESLVADGLGTINTTTDSLALGALGFSGGPTAPGSRIGPRFLVWDAVAPAPPAGFVGFPAVDHTVTGSPCGTNFFRVVGPGLPAAGVQTNFFSLAGRIQDVCGNGILDVSEQCDDGNKVAGDCCAPNCTFEAAGSPCTAASICTSNACDGAGVCAVVSITPGAACSDGNVCTVADTCTLTGTCVGAARSCDDLNVCTTDLCTPPAVGCENLNNAVSCTDGNATTSLDACAGGACMGAIRRATLGLNAGVNPSLTGFTAVGDARTDGVRTRVSLINMDPARFPAGCSGTVRVGAISGTGTIAAFAAQAAPLVRATAFNFSVGGAPPAGSAIDLRITCGANQTRWAGTLANVAPPACVPTTCAAQGKNCGTIPDGCGGTLACGVCTAPQTCGGAGVANVCGVPAPCVPTTCAAQGKNCGTIPDGCGGTLTCGVCTAPATCGGAGVANVCGVAPATATLTLTATGRGGESVLSTPAGLNVPTGTTASASFATGTSIRLSATNGRSVIWSGVCSSGGQKTPTCTFTLTANASETANVQ